MPEGYYEHSGRYSIGALLTGVVGGSLVGAILAFAYAYLVLYVPIVGFITFIVSAAFGLLVGKAVGFAFKRLRVRNSVVVIRATLLIMLFSLYVSWGVWVYALLARAKQSADLLIIMRPDVLWEFMKLINATGSWHISYLTPTGMALWVLWVFEGALILFVSYLVARGTIATEPFCESCQVWCKRQENVTVLAKVGSGELKTRLEGKDFQYLERLGAPTAGAIEWLRLVLHTCPNCKLTNTLSVMAARKSIDEHGKASVRSVTLIDKLMINSSEASKVQEIGEGSVSS